MKTFLWNIVWAVVVVTLAAAPVFARVTPAQNTVGEKTEDGAQKAKDAVVKGTKTAASKTKDGLSKTGEVMTDGWITTRVHTAFVGEDLLKNSDISVDTSKHVVTLKGTVTSAAARMKAASIAKQTEGVHRVVNHLTVAPKRST